MATHGHGGVIRWRARQRRRVGGARRYRACRPRRPRARPGLALPDADASSIVLALDGSPTAREAVPAALSLARAIGASVRIVHVPRPDDAPVDDWDLVLASFAAEGIVATFERVDGFDPAAAVAETAARHRATFVVAATHGRTGLARVTLGSVVQRIVRRAACPVLVVRPTVLTVPIEDEAGAGATGEEVGHARRGWRRDRGRPQPSGSAAPQG
ncbi:MAG: universal stress protein [Acidimicrobiia bacterium]